MPSLYRHDLPQLKGVPPFLTDGGLETTLVFHERIPLPEFAAFVLLATPEGRATLRRYFHVYGRLARRFQAGLILDTVTWRANPDWGERLGYSREGLAEVNRTAVAFMEEIREEMVRTGHPEPVVICGCAGPRGDGYVPTTAMAAAEAEDYHRFQMQVFADSAADMVSAVTMNYAAEATGAVRASRAAGMPVAISFTLETDGRLPNGQALGEAIREVDAGSGAYASYFMINCAHPTHFLPMLEASRGEPWLERIRGVRANSSRRSHAELNEAADLDTGDPRELGQLYAKLRGAVLPRLDVLGGCCGTDHRHIERIAEACLG